MKTTGFVYHDDYLKHDTGSFHPETPDRLVAIMSRLRGKNFIEKLYRIEPVEASIEEVEYVHHSSYIRSVEEICLSGGGMLDPDTPVCKDTFKVALLSVGGAIRAVEEVMASNIKNAFALIRPPGHHATPNRGMGFCIFNNVAITAEYLKRKYGLRRILIVDWDVHHGNGTQEIFFDDPSVLYFSTHQYPYYPGTGWIKEIGKGEGRGYTINVPLPAGVDDEGYLYVMREILKPIAMDFSPEFVLVSAGFDAHIHDPLASMRLTSNAFGLFTDIVKEIADKKCKDRVVILLEGGYNLDALAESVVAVFNSLSRRKEGEEEVEERVSMVVKKRVEEVKRIQNEYWKL
ncbi:MAG: histone deacetylase family protein [Candidatus Methanospirareceae archaeon]